MTNEKLAWLAGLWDGEGTITVYHSLRRKGTSRYHPGLVLANCDENIISEAVKILDEIGVKMFLTKVKMKSERHKDAFLLTTRKLSPVKKLCETLLPYLIGKKAQAELTLRFVNSRLATFERLGRWNQGSEYTEEEVSLCEQLKKLNKRGKSESSTAIRLTPWGEDMV